MTTANLQNLARQIADLKYLEMEDFCGFLIGGVLNNEEEGALLDISSMADIVLLWCEEQNENET